MMKYLGNIACGCNDCASLPISKQKRIKLYWDTEKKIIISIGHEGDEGIVEQHYSRKTEKQAIEDIVAMYDNKWWDLKLIEENIIKNKKEIIYTPDSTVVQSLVFLRAKDWTAEKAKDWAAKEGYKYGDVDIDDTYVRLRQIDPEEFKLKAFMWVEDGKTKTSKFVTQTFSEEMGIRAIIGKPLKNNPKDKFGEDTNKWFDSVAEISKHEKLDENDIYEKLLRLTNNPPTLITLHEIQMLLYEDAYLGNQKLKISKDTIKSIIYQIKNIVNNKYKTEFRNKYGEDSQTSEFLSLLNQALTYHLKNNPVSDKERRIIESEISETKENPEKEVPQSAINEFTAFHWGNQPEELKEVQIDKPECLVYIGKLIGVIYECEKGDEGVQQYIHEFEQKKKDLADLAYNPKTKRLHIVGGKYTVLPEGID